METTETDAERFWSNCLFAKKRQLRDRSFSVLWATNCTIYSPTDKMTNDDTLMFVYGTLKRGLTNHTRYLSLAARWCNLCR